MPSDPVIRNLVFTGHAARQMFARRITVEQVRAVVETGELVKDYPDEKPFPCRLLLGWPGGRALHVVVAYDTPTQTGHVVTAYEPDPGQWTDDFKRRRNA